MPLVSNKKTGVLKKIGDWFEKSKGTSHRLLDMYKI